MREVREYRLRFDRSEQGLAMPAGARVLYIAPSALTMFVLADPNAALTERRFMVIGTNEAFDEKEFRCDYIGSCVIDLRGYHVVEVVG